MVQRIQTVYLALVALFHLLLFFLPIFTWDKSAAGETGNFSLTAMYNIPLIILNILVILFSVFVITQYKLRLRQRNLVYVLTAIIIAMITLCMLYMFRITTSMGYEFIPAQSFGMFMQLISIILCFLASRKIKKDDDLVKSVDRIR